MMQNQRCYFLVRCFQKQLALIFFTNRYFMIYLWKILMYVCLLVHINCWNTSWCNNNTVWSFYSLVAASPPQTVATSTTMRRFGPLEQDWYPTLTAIIGTMTKGNFVIPVTLAKLVCWLASGRVGGRSQWSTLSY